MELNPKAILAVAVTMFFLPYRKIVQALINELIDVLTVSVEIYPNPPVETIHTLTLVVAVAASTLVVAASGFYHITGREFGLSYEDVRSILPRLIIWLGFAVVALPLLQIGLDLADAFVQAFRPQDTLNVEQLAGLTAGFVVVWFIDAWLLLALVILLVGRYIYLVFLAAVAPLIAVGWALPGTRPYARSFASAWWALLAVAPADILVLRFAVTMVEGSGETGIQAVSNWVIGIGAFGLMLWIPYQLLLVSQGLVGGRNLAGRIRSAWRRRRPPGGGSGGGVSDEEMQRMRREQRRRDRDQRW